MRSREGEEVQWSLKAARKAATIRNMMDDAEDSDIYPVPFVATEALRTLGMVLESDGRLEAGIFDDMSVLELLSLADGASSLDAEPAFEHVQLELARRLDGKSREDLRQVLGASDDDRSAAECVAAMAEPTFILRGDADTNDQNQPPGLQPQPSDIHEDDINVFAVGQVCTATLIELKGVSRMWASVARRSLCRRIYHRRDGAASPAKLDEVTDLNIQVLLDAGRAHDTVAAGQLLRNLQRLHGYGFEVDVEKVRSSILPAGPTRGPLGGAALRVCITGDGQPPAELLCAAVACAANHEVVHGIPVRRLREDDGIDKLDLRGKDLGGTGARLLGFLLSRAKSVRCLELDRTPLEIKKLRGEEPVESIDLSYKRLTVLSAVIIASLLPSNTATKSLKYAASQRLGEFPVRAR